MPKITVTAPFNFAIGPSVKHYAKGEQDVPQAVAAHAAKNGFLGAGTLTITNLATGALSEPMPVESLTLDTKRK
jgi:hypothetical protein